jgi:hypothetical protein
VVQPPLPAIARALRVQVTVCNLLLLDLLLDL